MSGWVYLNRENRQKKKSTEKKNDQKIKNIKKTQLFKQTEMTTTPIPDPHKMAVEMIILSGQF